ncbi:exosome complex protein Rrp42 [Candidatus Woesearchaeota archaeon]|nr:exosome complex protein Rrp42 [Candidatus Woesearchaeota archaeon]
MNNEFKNHIIQALDMNVRSDGRKLDEFREISVTTDVSKTAEGSAIVKVGDTVVIAGVKLDIGAPFPDRPDEGAIMVNVELLPLSNPDFEPGPPSIEAIELARVVDRGIRESRAIDVKKLAIKKGEKCWLAQIDICTINDAGSLLDASALATIAALKNTRFPAYENEEIDYKNKTDKTLELEKIPVSVTVFKIGKNYLVDPLKEEEKNYDARLTVALTEDNTLCALQKGGELPLTTDDISRMIDIASEKAAEIRKYI